MSARRPEGWYGLSVGGGNGHYVRAGKTLCGRYREITARNSWPLRKLRPALQREVERLDYCARCKVALVREAARL